MAQTLYPIERVAQKLGQKARARVSFLRDAVRPPGQRPPFTTQLTGAEAVDWWSQHRYDDLGQRVLQNYSQEQVAELDAELNAAAEQRMMGGGGPGAY